MQYYNYTDIESCLKDQPIKYRHMKKKINSFSLMKLKHLRINSMQDVLMKQTYHWLMHKRSEVHTNRRLLKIAKIVTLELGFVFSKY
jgi:hypothetical protein